MVTPSRITLARQRRGLTVVALARLVGVARQTLAAWEAGTQEPGAENVQALAAALAFPVPFFAAGDVEPVPLGAVSFRALSKMTASARDTALAAGRTAIMLNDWVEQRYVLPETDVPTLGLQGPGQAAEALRHAWGLGQGPVANMTHLLESKGVRVYALPVECLSVDAFSFRWFDTPVVLLTPGKSAERRRFDLAHELGHLVLHKEREGFQGPAAEDEANRFAAAFLMPRAALLARPLRSATLDTVLQEKRRWKVAAMALTYRLNELGFLSEWEYRNLCVELSRRGYRRSEPQGTAHEGSLIFEKVLRSLRARDSGLQEIADNLALTVQEVTQHLLGLALVPVAGHDTPARTTRAVQQPRHLRLA